MKSIRIFYGFGRSVIIEAPTIEDAITIFHRLYPNEKFNSAYDTNYPTITKQFRNDPTTSNSK